MALSKNQVKNWCQSDGDTRPTCKYLAHKMTSTGYVPVCTKQCKNQQSKISNQWALGDNCKKGYPLMLYVEQGYDVDK